ncbi:hypothetical protein F0562_017377 [Nyssa sinensis]|uniref:NB-ARC domain-containing protein n=1 Tax=Nyssa sinensis TaxID=561372 RepID=A0A5J4ZGW8_9ASTE|nr:hypothetical protein F0562_017377 [Nyssa sinensis]
MAESFVNNVFDKLSSFALEEVYLAWNVRNELQKLSKTSTSIEEFLWSNADQQQQQAKSRQDEWHEKIVDIFYDADDVLDEFQIELSKPQVFQGSISTKVRCFFSRSNPLAFRFKIAHKIKEINQRIAEIPCLQTESNDLAMQRGDGHAIHREREMTHSFILDSDVIGREEDKEGIVKLLMQLSDHDNVSVIPIVGIGGLGKTTLAKIVYNHKKIGEHFKLKMWVCVSNDFNFNLKKMIEKILRSATNGENFDHLEIEELQNKIRETLNQKRFLLRLDDIWNWNEEVAKWEEFRSLLTGAENGSKIIVTTRSKSVALGVGTFPSYNLELLHDDKCLSIFLKWAFRNRSQEINPKLVEIGKRIVRKCKGVPLAVRTLGCMLYSKTHERQWLCVLESEIWKLKQKDDDILPALRLSYNDLEPKIKRCFAYCSIFPKDSEINTYQLIQMWMAQGLIKLEDNSDQTQELEDVGMDYFHTLCSKSFFQDVKDHGFFFTFKMHDLLHDLALSVAQTKHSTIKSPAEKVSKNVRHVSFYDPDSPADELLIPLREKKKVCSIYFQFNRVKPVERSFVETCI